MSKTSETSHSITLTPEVLEKLSTQVTFETTAGLQQFVADAINIQDARDRVACGGWAGRGVRA